MYHEDIAEKHRLRCMSLGEERRGLDELVFLRHKEENGDLRQSSDWLCVLRLWLGAPCW